MNIRIKAQLFMVVLFLAVAVSAYYTVVLSGVFSALFALLTFALLFPLNFALRKSFRCPACGTPILDRGGFKIFVTPPAVCGRCDKDLTGG